MSNSSPKYEILNSPLKRARRNHHLHRHHPTSVDWRLSLHTAFIGNLSYKVSKGDLWEAFDAYGKVRDIYIPLKLGFRRNFTFAFVRYREEREMDRAISMGNGKMINGRNITITKVNYGWSQRRHTPSSMVGPHKIRYLQKQSNISNPHFSKSIRDTRT